MRVELNQPAWEPQLLKRCQKVGGQHRSVLLEHRSQMHSPGGSANEGTPIKFRSRRPPTRGNLSDGKSPCMDTTRVLGLEGHGTEILMVRDNEDGRSVPAWLCMIQWEVHPVSGNAAPKIFQSESL